MINNRQMRWGEFRNQLLLDPGVSYLNTGSFGPTPARVLSKMTELEQRFAAQPHQGIFKLWPEGLRAMKRDLGSFLGADPKNLAMIMNATLGMNMVLRGLKAQSGDLWLTTDQEYGAVENLLQFEERTRGVKIKRLPLRELQRQGEHGGALKEKIIELFREEIGFRPSILILSHVSRETGIAFPLQEICKIAREYGVMTVIDGAQAPGMLPMHLEQWGCDYYIGNCHKWLMAPMGTAFIFARPGMHDKVEPFVVGWGETYDERAWGPASLWERRFEFLGTRDLAAFIAVGEAIKIQRDIGVEKILERGRFLSQRVRERAHAAGFEILSPGVMELSTFLTVLKIPSPLGSALCDRLWKEHRIQVVSAPFEGATWLRVSTHYFNLEDEIEQLFKVLQDYL